jgi:ABC-2 type transport system permease protein
VIRAIRSEWIKLRTIRSNWVLVVLAALFPIVIVLLFAGLGNAENMEGEDIFNVLSASAILTQMLLGVLGVLSITGEYSSNTIRPTLAATPRRNRVMTAKGVVVSTVAVVVMAVVVAVSLVGGAAIADGRGADLGTSALEDLLAPAVGLVLFTGMVVLMGLGFGVILRSTPAAIALFVLWPLLVEGVIGGATSAAGLDGVGNWLPYGAGTTLSDLEPSGDPFGRITGGLWFAGFLAVLGAFGSGLLARRDA